jgi:recombination protein RecT
MSSGELTTRPNGSIEESCQATLLNVLAKNKKTIDAVLGQIMDPKRFAYLAVMAIRQTPALAGCSPFSFLNAVMLASQMGLEIRRDSAYLIPFGKECQLLIDYKGKLNLARRSGKVGGIQAVTIRENDDFEWGYDRTGVVFHHKPKFTSDRGPIVGVYSFAQVEGGTQFCEPMNLSDIDKIRRQARAGGKGYSIEKILDMQEVGADGKMLWDSIPYRDRTPWLTHFEAMAWKTSLHRLCKALPLDPAGQLSQDVDEGFETGKQPNILADAVEIDPADDKPMVEVADGQEDFQKRKETIVTAKTQPIRPGAGAKLSDPELVYHSAVVNFGLDKVNAAIGNQGWENWEDVPQAKRENVAAVLRVELGI